MFDSGVLLSSSLPLGSESVLTTCDTDLIDKDSLSGLLNANNFDTVAFKKSLLDQCMGKNECHPTMDLDSFMTLTDDLKMPNMIVFS